MLQMTQECSNMVYSARTHAHEIFSSYATFTPSLFRCPAHAQRTGNPMLRALLQDPKKKDEEYPLFPRILFPDDTCKVQDIFKSIVFVSVISLNPFHFSLPCSLSSQFLRIILFGPASITPGVQPTLKGKTRARRWSITKTTPGMIATAATIMRP
jgi:hypothetical protein